MVHSAGISSITWYNYLLQSPSTEWVAMGPCPLQIDLAKCCLYLVDFRPRNIHIQNPNEEQDIVMLNFFFKFVQNTCHYFQLSIKFSILRHIFKDANWYLKHLSVKGLCLLGWLLLFSLTSQHRNGLGLSLQIFPFLSTFISLVISSNLMALNTIFMLTIRKFITAA